MASYNRPGMASSRSADRFNYQIRQIRMYVMNKVLTNNLRGPHGVKTAHKSYKAMKINRIHVVHYMSIDLITTDLFWSPPINTTAYIREEGQKIADQTGDKHEECFLHPLRSILRFYKL